MEYGSFMIEERDLLMKAIPICRRQVINHRSFATSEVDMDDMYQQAMAACIARFDAVEDMATVGGYFRRIASGAIKSLLIDRGLVRPSQEIRRNVQKLRKIQSDLLAELHREPTVTETLELFNERTEDPTKKLDDSQINQLINDAHIMSDFGVIDEDQTGGSTPSPETELTQVEVQLALKNCLDQLSSEYREVIVGWYLTDPKVTLAQLADRLDVSIGTVHQWRTKAEGLLFDCLRAKNIEPSFG